MFKMGFSIKWCKWIMECLRSTTTSVFVNGSSTDEFHLGRGLRQDDPLSLFLFLIAAEGFNVMLNATIHAGILSGYNVRVDSIFWISHLQFVDDTLLLAEKIGVNIRAIKANLIMFQIIYCLKVNFHKSLSIGVNMEES